MKILFTIIWISICIYTDYKIYLANKKALELAVDYYKKFPLHLIDTFKFRYFKGACFLLYQILLLMLIWQSGLIIFKKDINVFTGNTLK